MNKFWAKVRFKQEKNAEYLIKAFFQDFNPESSIVVRGNEAKLEIVFREVPMEIINAISHCEVIELNYGKNLKEYEEDEIIQIETENDSKQENSGGESSEQSERENVKGENSEQLEQENTECESSEQIERKNEECESSERSEHLKKKNSRTVNKKKVSTTKVMKAKLKPVDIPELENIAKNAKSFEDFVKLVAEWLEMGKRQKFFENVAIVSTEVEILSWKEIEKALKKKSISYSSWDRTWTSQQISMKLIEHSVTALPFLNEISKYKNYSFGNAKEHFEGENVTKYRTEDLTQDVKEKTEGFDESLITKPRLKMECMPEIKEFEETLASVDKTKPVEDRVRYVLNAMGLKKMPAEEQKQIVEIASTAVRKEKMAFDIIFLEAKIPMNQTMDARMIFTKFVNDFVKKYESGKKIQLLTFLSELQKIIMLESEIESFSDFTD